MPRIRRALPLLALSFTLAALPAGASASITEYSAGLTAGSAPENIVTGPDGNLWFTQPGGSGSIGRMDAATHQVSEFPTPTTGSQPADIAVGPDGNLWFTEESAGGAIGRITPSGVITEFTAGLTGMNSPEGITAGPDGNLWFTESGNWGRIGRITTAGVITEYPLVNFQSEPTDIAAGEDGNLWFTEQRDPGRIGRISPSTGIVTEFTEGLTPNAGPNQIVASDSGKLYFTMEADPGRIGRIKTDGRIEEYAIPTANSRPAGITEGGDGALWFTQATDPGGLGRLFEDSILEFAGGTAFGFTANSGPQGITQGPDGNVWFTESAAPARIGHITVPPGADINTPDAIENGVRLRARVRPNAQATDYHFEYGPEFASQTATTSAGAGSDPIGVSADVTELARDSHHQVRVSATNASGTTVSEVKAFYLTATGEVVKEKPPQGMGDGSSTVTDPTPTVSASVATPSAEQTASQVAAEFPPVLGESFVAAPVSGSVLIKPPGARLFKPLARGVRVRVGSLLDTRRGTVEIVSARNRTGGSQKGTFWGGVFQVRQARASRGLTDLVLRAGNFAGCGTAATAGKARASVLARDSGSRRIVRRLWGKDSHARFRTHGRDSVATVRGTVWATTDRCDGTLTTVKQGKVSVRNRHSGRSVLLTAGHSYLARHR